MTHGSHWECIVPNVEIFFETHFNDILQNSQVIEETQEYGYNIATEQDQDNKIYTLLYTVDKSVPYLYLTQIVNRQLWTAYPVLNFAITHEVIIVEIIEEGNFVEARIRCKLAEYPDFQLVFFDTMYHRHKSRYVIGKTYPFLLNGFMYRCGKNQYVDTKLPNVDLEVYIDKNTVVCIGDDEGDIDDYKVMSPIQECESFNTPFGKAYKMKIVLLQGGANFSLPVLVAEHQLKEGFIPQKGESINGSFWLCGMLNTE